MPILANDRQTMGEKKSLLPLILKHITYSLGTTLDQITPRGKFQAVALALRDQIIERQLATERRYREAGAKRLYYLSMEFLIGRSLDNNLVNLGLRDTCLEAIHELGWSLEDVEGAEVDAALGNGGLGRLAACFLDSLATHDYPGYGYGINYDYGLFKQEIRQGEQVERPDNWKTYATPWLIERQQDTVFIPAYGHVEHGTDRQGRYNPMWLEWKTIIAVPFDFPIVGYGGQTVNSLRLFSARASQEFDMSIFNEGDYVQAVHQKVFSETISKVLYPKEAGPAGRELRLLQEYFLSACAVRDLVRRYLRDKFPGSGDGTSGRSPSDFDSFPDKVAIQLNDTHPALGVAELMRILIDENELTWEKAWEITQATFAYTNHTLLPEALERWPVGLLEYIVPRHLQILYEINRRFLEDVARRYPGDDRLLRRVSLFEGEGREKQARMAHLAIVGSHSVNGVAEVHSRLVQTDLVPDFYRLMPEKFNNKTNGVTPRRWLLSSNPTLSRLISDAIGTDWITDLDQLHELERFQDDSAFLDQLLQVKKENKRRFIKRMEDLYGATLDDGTLFDIHVKRIHEYKRQLLNVLHIVHEYLALVDEGQHPITPRTYLFGGKAAPGYYAAKLIIRLINDVAAVVNADLRARKHMKVFFVPDYRVSMAELMIPAADLSEQISTAGTEASGTGNMKFALNGALTIGTLDGANIEIREEVGDENIFIFGLTVEDVRSWRSQGYHPWEVYHNSPKVRRVLDAFTANRFCPRNPGQHQWVAQRLLAPGERFFHLADLDSYIAAHEEAARQYHDQRTWARMALLNIARSGKFSSDRTINEYAEEIWDLKTVR
jgi:starch phosphorylase